MKRIREETISRTERYSELINESNSNDFLFKIANDNKKKKKLKQIETNKETNSSNNTMDNLENQKKQEIDPNKERIYNSSQPYLFIKGEPFIVLGPDTQYYVWIFSITSFFSIIIYCFYLSLIILLIVIFLLNLGQFYFFISNNWWHSIINFYCCFKRNFKFISIISS